MKPTIKYNDQIFEVNLQESVLDTLLRNKIEIKHGCKSGICQACILQGEGNICSLSKENLSQGQFLSCQCFLKEGNITINNTEKDYTVKVLDKQYLTNDILVLKLAKPYGYNYQAGQYCFLNNNDISRPYSLASTSHEDYLEFHIKVVPNGKLSSFLYNDLKINSSIKISTAKGNCTLQDTKKTIVLAATGTGLAPLWGIIKQALHQKRDNKFIIFHGTRHMQDLYYHHKLTELSLTNENIEYYASVTQEESSLNKGRLNDYIFNKVQELNLKFFYLCGNPDFVNSLQQQLFLQDVPLNQIIADPFTKSS